MNKLILLLGAGGHASVLADILRQQGKTITGIFSPSIDLPREALAGIKHFKNDVDVLDFDNAEVMLVNGVGSLPQELLRSRLYQQFVDKGYLFESVIADSAIISPYAEIGQGVQIMHGVIIQAGAVIGDNAIINTGAIIEHDCEIGPHNHIAPGVTLSGQVKTGQHVHIGTGANVIQSVHIADHAVIGAGAVVTRHVPANHTVFPARTAQIKHKG